MISFGARLKTPPPSAEKIDRNIRYGTAVGLTRTVQGGQKAVLGALKGAFELRGNWYKPSNHFGIKIKTAKRDDLNAAVHTRADWLMPHETGATKYPYGNFFAVPTSNIRRTKRQIVMRSQRPRRLKNTFVIKTKKHGVHMLMQRFGHKGSKEVRAMYVLIPKTDVKKRSTFVDPLNRHLERNLSKNIAREVHKALQTMK